MARPEEAYLRMLEDRRRKHLLRLAEAAESMAATAEASARVHDQMAERQCPGAAEHAARDRLLAAAERDAARAYRAGQSPSETTRAAIRACGRKRGA